MIHLGKNSRRVKDLRRRVRKRVPGEVIVDGEKLVTDLVRWGVAIRELYLAVGADEEQETGEWIESAAEVFGLDGEVLTAIAPTKTPQGVLAVVEEPRSGTWSAGDGVGLYLEGVQDPGNLGAIVRSAAALGAASVLLSPGCADPFGPAAVRGSAGTIFRLPVEREASLTEASRRVRDHDGEVWAAALGGTSLKQWKPARPLLLIMGAEGAGLSDAVLGTSDGRVGIPLEREVESLNVAVAAGILLAALAGQ